MAGSTPTLRLILVLAAIVLCLMGETVAWRRRRRCVDTTCTGQTRSPEETEKKPTTTSATATADNANATSDNANATAAKTTADNATADNATASTSRSTGDQVRRVAWLY
jgi:hypothetical protein